MTDDTTTDEYQGGTPYRSGRRRAVRVLVPAAVAALVAAGVGLVPALAADSAPSLPTVTAEQLVAKALGSQTQTLSGTVQISTDLGVPAQLLGAAGGIGGGPGAGGGGARGGSSAAPEAKLTELLGGDHTLRVAVDGPDRQRIGLIEKLAEYELVHNGDQVWAWDSSTNEAVHLTAPQGGAGQHRAPLTGVPTTPQEAARQFLALSSGTTEVTVDGTANVAGRRAYQLSVKPAQAGSTIGEVRIAVDADNGVPLAVVVKAASGGGTVFDAHFKDVSFARPDAKTFEFSAPKGAKVTERQADAAKAAKAAEAAGAAADEARKGGPAAKGPMGDVNVVGEGWTSVLSTRLPDEAAAPARGKQGGEGRGMSVQSLAKGLGKPVDGGSLISTKVLNVLITDDGRVFAGAVTLPVLQSAAGVK
ncbi:outer membrane lipoprotein carrier protein LolA [Kitasatospora sp. NPDC050543]|uniref:outer membrane lipoprotein carrier protein LolA n=1 Tax=Kitasatospora sp. NPDC050543 TaxID=3364054 RepID=UPI0037ABA2C8